MHPAEPGNTRRDFLKWSAAIAAGAALPARAAASVPATLVHPGGDERTLRVGLVGCGGRGTGAAANALRTAGPVELVALADVFPERIDGALKELGKPQYRVADRVKVEPERRYSGFDAAQRLIASDLDVVLLATPPHFRPAQFQAAVEAGRHVFMEKPVAVDGPGVRTVLAAAETAAAKKLSVVCGLQRHHQNGYRETMRRVHDGALGDIVAARAYWNMGGLWMHPRQPQWSDMEWQLRNWLYFTWLSGDHIVEQHVHNLDVVNWAKKAHPVRAEGMGGRQVRTEPAYGHIYDHHAVNFEYADGSWLFSQCRQIDGCANRVSEHLIGTAGRADLDSERWSIRGGGGDWSFDPAARNDPYQTEHDDFFASIREERGLNEGRFVAESTLTAVMGRMATYSGKVVTWEEALNSPERLGPSSYAFGALPVAPVAMPGRDAGH